MRQLTDSERAAQKTSLREYWVKRDGLLPKETRAFEAGFIAALDHSAEQPAALTTMTLCQCGHEESYHDNEDSHCDYPHCTCEYFSPDYPALEAQIAALTAERDGLRAALQQTQDERGRLRDALTDMLYIFDRGLPEDSIGRMRCDQARDALNLTAT